MNFLNKNPELFTQCVWERIIENYIEFSHKETVVEDSIDTYHAEVDGFNLHKITLKDKVGIHKDYKNGFIITGDLELLIIPHEEDEDLSDNIYDVFSRTNWYGEYIQHIEYLWGLWDRRKYNNVVYKHTFEKALLPDERHTLKIEPDKFINREGEEMEISDLSFLRNHKA